MYTSLHGNNNSIQDLQATIGALREDGQHGLANILQTHFHPALQKLVEEVEDLNRKQREGENGSGGGGSYGNVRTGSNLPRKIVPVCTLSYQTQSFGKDMDMAFSATDTINTTPWDRGHPIEIYKPVSEVVTLTKAMGYLLIESNGTQSRSEHFLDMPLDMGSGQVGPNHLLSFACGFERFNAERLKFFLDVFEYERELSNANTTLLVNKIPITSRKFRSDQPILTDPLLAEYQSSGLRVYLDLTIFGSV